MHHKDMLSRSRSGARTRTMQEEVRMCPKGRWTRASDSGAFLVARAVAVGLAAMVGVCDGGDCPLQYNCIFINTIPESGYTFEWIDFGSPYALPYMQVYCELCEMKMTRMCTPA